MLREVQISNSQNTFTEFKSTHKYFIADFCLIILKFYFINRLIIFTNLETFSFCQKMVSMPATLPDSDSEDDLPPGWEERATVDGSVYYVK